MNDASRNWIIQKINAAESLNALTELSQSLAHEPLSDTKVAEALAYRRALLGKQAAKRGRNAY